MTNLNCKYKIYKLILSLLVFQLTFHGCENQYTIPTNSEDDIIEDTNYETDLEFLNNLISINNLSTSDPNNIGFQVWENNRLTELVIENNPDISIIPSSINYLDELDKLILNNNSIVHIPANICQLDLEFSDPTQFSVSGNYLCPNDVPYCIENIINSENQFCDWSENDLFILQELININGLEITVHELGAFQTWDWGRITSLIFPGYNEYGTIHTLPESIDLLEKLQYIDLNNNIINLLPESFGYLENLEFLNLSSNRILYLPDSFGELTSLGILNLYDNNLSYLPPDFSNLNSCIQLDLSYNLFEEFPNSVLELPYLEELNLSINYINQIPDEISNLNNINWIDLHHNAITHVSNSIEQLSFLNYFDIGYNSLENFNISLNLMSSLSTLYLDNNNLINISETICGSNLDITNRYNFLIHNNNLCVESVPHCISDTDILGNQNCIGLVRQNIINH